MQEEDESVEFPVNGVLDLHTFLPAEVGDLVPHYLELCRNRGILEVRISHSSPCVGRSVKDLQFPRGSLLVALQHKFKAKVPAADDVILAGDRVVVAVNHEQEKALLERLV